jgi:hypothetical protein
MSVKKGFRTVKKVSGELKEKLEVEKCVYSPAAALATIEKSLH